MKLYKFSAPSYLLTCLLVFVTACTAQVKPNLSANRSSAISATSTKQAKLVKTLGTNDFAAVSCGLQAKDGTLWFGTSGEGIYCYTPTAGFSNYTSNDGLCDNNITSMVEDREGAIWIGTSSGLCRCDSYAGKLTFTKVPISISNLSQLYPSPTSSPITDQPSINALLLDRSGKLWIGTATDGVYHYDLSSENTEGTNTNRPKRSIVHFLHDGSVVNSGNLKLTAITGIAEDRRGNIWFSTWFEGLCCFDGKTLTNYKPNGDRWFGSVFEGSKGNLWAGTRDHGVYRYDPSSDLESVAGIPSSTKYFVNYFEKEPIFNKCCVDAIKEDQEGKLWFGTEYGNPGQRDNLGGLWCHTPTAADATAKSTMINYTKTDGLSHPCIFSLTLDRSGKLWIGTRATGLCCLDVKSSEVGKNSITNYSDYKSKNIRRVFEDRNGYLWLATKGDGVCRYDANAAHRKASKSQAVEKVGFTYLSTKDGLSGNDVRQILEDPKGNLWFGTNGGLSKYDGKRFTNYTTEDGLASNDVWSLCIDKTGTIWVGTREGVCRYSPKSNTTGATLFSAFPIPAAADNDYSREVASTKLIWDIKADQAGNIWFASNGGGVYRFGSSATKVDKKSKEASKPVLTNISDKDGLCNNYVNCILEDKQGDLWFGTQHGGVSRYHPNGAVAKEQFITFTTKEGLCGNEIWSMSEDKAGDIWFAANALVYPAKHTGSVCRYNPSSVKSVGQQFEQFTERGGLLSDNYVQSILEDSNGVIWIGTLGGLCKMDRPLEHNTNKNAPVEKQSFINVTKEWSLGKM